MQSARIRIGNQTARSAPALMAPFEYAVENGFDAFEWFPDRDASSGRGWDENDVDAESRSRIQSAALRHDIRLSVHAPWQANPLRPEAQPLLYRSLDFAREIGAALLNVHLFVEEGMAAYARAVAPFAERAYEAGIRLSIENTPLTTPGHFNELFSHLRETRGTGADEAGMCFDIGHANLCDVTRNDYLRYLGELDPEVPIIHLHLHENWGDRDSHLPIFTGPAARDSRGIELLLERLAQRGFSGSAVLEQWPDPPSLLLAARERLRGILSQPRSSSTQHLPASEDEDGFVDLLVQGNLRCRSWREKLEFVREMIASLNREPSTGELIDLFIYLRFLGTGEVACVEDGRHFRPSHAARASVAIQDRLAAIADPDRRFVLRKIYPWLPSTDQAFLRPEPLTRIRDIAHRNDIPQDLKREIKNTLQNKLHRCAGPEDLETSAAILKRITAPGSHYPVEFVQQFKMFHEELTEFFSARSLEELLHAIAVKIPEYAAPIHEFLTEKERGAVGGDGGLTVLQCLTDLRRALLAGVERDSSGATQELRLADIALENFAFVLLSSTINSLDSDSEIVHWGLSLKVMRLAVANVSLSGFSSAECGAIDAELAAWSQSFVPSDREQLLRLKATLDRARRLADGYSDHVMSLFPSRVARLGRALGVAEHAIAVFVEGDIRGHIVFQLSKLASGLLKNIRRLVRLPAGDVLVAGKAVGRVMLADSLRDLSDSCGGPVLALLRRAQGDEEIPAQVRGIVLAHEIPHLSHLGVRARQVNVVFAACEEPDEFAKFEHLERGWAVLDATAQGFDLKRSSEPEWRSVQREADGRSERITVPEVCLRPASAWLPLDAVIPENGGGKAAGARRLMDLSRNGTAGFRTPRGFVVPFGVMEAALGSAPAIETEYFRLIAGLNGLQAADYARIAERLRSLIQALPVPSEISEAAADTFQDLTAGGLMVRSSANCEDLTQLSGAGLYDSIANVRQPGLGDAIRKVWGSLWTERAILSRKQAGIPHDKAHMAVLIQEMVPPDYSFVMHTVNPISRNRDEVYVELAAGLGEVLAAAPVPGSPYRLVSSKASGDTQMLAFASFSNAIQPDPSGGTVRRTVEYSKISLSVDYAFAKALGRRLAAIGRSIEDALGQPQDIEGAVAGDDVYIVQARPQQGRL